MAAEFPELIIRSHDDLATVFRQIKEFLSLSNEQLEAISGMAQGAVDKCLGPSRAKRIGYKTFDLLLGAMAVQLRVEIDPDQAQRVASRWVKRNSAQVRNSQPISQATLDRCRPVILSEMARKGWQTRNRRARNGHNGHART